MQKNPDHENSHDLEIVLEHKEIASRRVGHDKSSDHVYVFFLTSVKERIHEYLSSDTARELGGILLGEHKVQGTKTLVYVRNFIKARYSESSQFNIKFTHKTWDYINMVHEDFFPRELIVGWFHSHPGFGVFMSDYDLFIQENFFQEVHQVAYVYDPLSGKSGFFGKTNSSVSRVRHEEVNSPLSGRSSAARREPFKKSPYPFWLMVISAVVLALGLAAFSLYQYMENLSLAEELNKLKASQEELSSEVLLREEKTSALEQELAVMESSYRELNAVNKEYKEENAKLHKRLQEPHEEDHRYFQNTE